MKQASNKKRKSRSGWIMLVLTVIIYLVTASTEPSLAYAALTKSFEVLKMIAPIMLAVMLLMALIATFIKPKGIARHLGEESGLKGWLLALTGGVLSHGSTLVWYPMLSELREHGARDGLIVAFFYARAIKLPWLPVMIGYFGLTFTVVLTFYIVLAAWIQGVLTDRLLQGEHHDKSK